MTTLRTHSLLAAIALLCGGCVTVADVRTSDCALRISQGGQDAKAGDKNLIDVVGLRIVRNPDRSLTLVFPSGRGKTLGLNDPAPTSTKSMAGYSPCALAEPVHRLPAALSAEIRSAQEPYSTGALRAGLALLAHDHVPFRGEAGRLRFFGWVRLTDTRRGARGAIRPALAGAIHLAAFISLAI